MKRLPLGISTFSKLIEGNYVYVDKTAYIYDLIENNNYSFLSRPRRFGKSLLISTLQEIFLGNKHLFEGLDISKTDYNWKKYPIIRLDFSAMDLSSPEEFKRSIIRDLNSIRSSYHLELFKDGLNITNQLKDLIENLYKIEKVVILIDEYDAPITRTIKNTELMHRNHEVLKEFYSAIKSLDQYIHKFFMTGVTKFAQTSLFSGPNNVKDISLLPTFGSILGYTQEELDHYFDDYIKYAANFLETPIDELKGLIKFEYNGYKFSNSIEKVYNPFSITNFFYEILNKNKHALKNYWAQSGTSEYLMQIAKKNRESLISITNNLNNNKAVSLPEASLLHFTPENVPLDSLLLQSGYLTITGYENKEYQAYYPNNEVHEALEKYLLEALINFPEDKVIDKDISVLRKSLEINDLERFFWELEILVSGIPGNLNIHEEKYYHTVMETIAKTLNLKHISEERTNFGISDLVIETEKYIYVLEFKINKSAHEALEQIEEKKYYKKYLASEKLVTLVGVSFHRDPKKNTIEWISKIAIPN